MIYSKSNTILNSINWNFYFCYVENLSILAKLANSSIESVLHILNYNIDSLYIVLQLVRAEDLLFHPQILLYHHSHRLDQFL